MSGNKIHKKFNLEEIQDYLNNRMTEKDRNVFEREMQKNPFLADAVDGLSGIKEEEAIQDISSINSRILQYKHSGKMLLIYRYAASIAFLAVLSLAFYTIFLRKTGIIPPEVIVSEARKETDQELLPDLQKEETKKTETLSPVVAGEEAKSMETNQERKTVLREEPEKEELIAEVDNEELYILEALKVQEEEEITEFEVQDEIAGKTEIIPENQVLQYRMSSETLKKSHPLAAAPVNAIISSKEGMVLEGKVISAEDSLPVYGGLIYFKDSGKGVLTDLNGKFKIHIPEKEEVSLVADFIGMKRKEIAADMAEKLLIVLEPLSLGPDEIVITGYGIMGEDELRGIVSTPPFHIIKPLGYKPASPVTGAEEFKNYIKNNLNFPEDTGLKKAVVVLNFIVGTNGDIKNISRVRSNGSPFYIEAVRLLSEGPSWVPAQFEDKKIEEAVRLMIIFRQ